MKSEKTFFGLFVLLNLVGIGVIIILFLNYRSLSRTQETILSESDNLRERLDSISRSNSLIETDLNKEKSENENLKRIKANTFQEFAKDFLTNAFGSKSYFLEHSEGQVISSGIDGDDYIQATQTYESILSLKNFRSKVRKNEIYLYEVIYEYDPKGSEQGVTLHFRKDSDNQWKLWKMSYDGC